MYELFCGVDCEERLVGEPPSCDKASCLFGVHELPVARVIVWGQIVYTIKCNQDNKILFYSDNQLYKLECEGNICSIYC